MMPSKTPSILIGALVYALVGAVMSFVATSGGMVTAALGGCGACLAMLSGPMVGVWHYVSTNRLTIPAGSGAGLGAVAGLAGGVLGYALTAVLRAIDVLPTAAEMLERQREMMIGAGLDAAQVDEQLAAGSAMSGPVAEIAISVIGGLIIGAIGGAVAASVFKKGEADDYEV